VGETWINLGIAQADQGRFEEAEASYRRALHLNPDSEKVAEKAGRDAGTAEAKIGSSRGQTSSIAAPGRDRGRGIDR
jgi:cytochrome c-type biogenesis protein CcmH/NrfG